MSDDWSRWFGGDEDDDEPRDAPRGDERESLWDRTVGKRFESLRPEVIKRAIAGSLGSLFLSEDGLRHALSDLKLPREMIQYIIQQADHTKREFMRLIARELRDFMESTNFYEELQRILTSLSFEVRTEIRLIPNDQAIVKPEFKNKVRVKRNGQDITPPDDDDDTPAPPDPAADDPWISARKGAPRQPAKERARTPASPERTPASPERSPAKDSARKPAKDNTPSRPEGASKSTPPDDAD